MLKGDNTEAMRIQIQEVAYSNPAKLAALTTAIDGGMEGLLWKKSLMIQN